MDLRERIEAVKKRADQPAKKGQPKRSFNPLRYLKESIQELRKVNWPGSKEVTRGTVGVIVVTLIFVALLGGSDIIFQKGLNRIIGEEAIGQESTIPTDALPITEPEVELDPFNLPGNIPPPPGLEESLTPEGGVEGDSGDIEIPVDTGAEEPPAETEN